MRQFMVVYSVDGESGATFCDTVREADNVRMDIAVSLGGMAQVYEWMEVREVVGDKVETIGSEYRLIYE